MPEETLNRLELTRDFNSSKISGNEQVTDPTICEYWTKQEESRKERHDLPSYRINTEDQHAVVIMSIIITQIFC